MSKFVSSDRLASCTRPLALFLAGLACNSAFAQSAPPPTTPKDAGGLNGRPAAPGAPNAKGTPATSAQVAAASPPAASGNSAQADQPDVQRKFAAMSVELKQRVAQAADRVMIRLVQAEGNLYRRFSYFQKPERLDPGTFNSKDEVTAWKDSLKQFRGDEAVVEKLYANVSDDLENALIGQRIDVQLATSIKQQLVSSIPWETVQQKEKLIGEFIDSHDKLLSFYADNWGSWKTSSRPGIPEFDNVKLAGAYRQLHDKITTSGQQIDQLYAKLKQ